MPPLLGSDPSQDWVSPTCAGLQDLECSKGGASVKTGLSLNTQVLDFTMLISTFERFTPTQGRSPVEATPQCRTSGKTHQLRICRSNPTGWFNRPSSLRFCVPLTRPVHRTFETFGGAEPPCCLSHRARIAPRLPNTGARAWGFAIQIETFGINWYSFVCPGKGPRSGKRAQKTRRFVAQFSLC